MRYLRDALIAIIATLCAFGIGSLSQAQDSPLPEPARNVAFVDGRPLNTASVSNVGDDGLSRLAQLFTDLGASTRTIGLDEPIPPDVEIVVIIRPQRPLSAPQTAHLWDFLQRGGHLLLALDPNGHNRVNTERARNSGINRLLELDYGTSIVDDLLIEPWFSVESLSDVVTSWTLAQPDSVVPHPITEPLVTYDLPLRFWGGRSLFVEALTGSSDTNALIYAESPYGETGRVNFRAEEPGQLTRNIGQDTQGRLLLGAVATHFATGSRVALIGDSEIFQNIYGQTRIPDRESLPRYPGDFIFTRRLLAWLMGLPVEDWPGLPDGLTWLALDGDLSDWPTGLPEAIDLAFDVDRTGYDLYRTQMFRNDQFLYIALETLDRVPEDAQIHLRFGEGEDTLPFLLAGGEVNVLLFPPDIVEPVEDASYSVSSNIEVRLPLRQVGDNPLLTQVCITGASNELSDCFEEAITATQVDTIEPVPLRFGPAPSAFVLNSANLRAGPGTDFDRVTTLPARTLLAVTGRNEEGDWLKVRNGRYDGWMASFLLSVNADIGRLPVVQ